MTAQCLTLAVVLVFRLSRFICAGGTLLAAIGLAFIVLSIYLADTDGTFAAAPASIFGRNCSMRRLSWRSRRSYFCRGRPGANCTDRLRRA
jgi:hypothetical protein